MDTLNIDGENNPADVMSPTSNFIECPKGLCAKKFRDLDALKYHLSYSHDNLNKAAELKAEKLKLEQKLLAEQRLAEQKLQAMIKEEKSEVSNSSIKNSSNTNTNGSSSKPAPPTTQQNSSCKDFKQEITVNTSTTTTANTVMVKTENNGAVNRVISEQRVGQGDNSTTLSLSAAVPPTTTSSCENDDVQEIKPDNYQKFLGNQSVTKTDRKMPLHHPASHPNKQEQGPQSVQNLAPAVKQQPQPQISDAPLDLQKRPPSSAYSDISDEEPTITQPPPRIHHITSKPTNLASPMSTNIPTLNSLLQRTSSPINTGHLSGKGMHTIMQMVVEFCSVSGEI